MKIVNQYRYWLLTLLALLSVGTWAQQKNVLSIPDAKVSIGQAQLPVAIENTDEIIAAQFDLTLPSTISAGTEGTVTNRCDGHTVIIRKMEATRYRVMLYSDENRALIAQQGTVLYIPLTIPQTVAEGSELPLVISNATLTVTGGANVLTDTKAGKLIVSTLPDLTVKGIAANSNAITPGERLSLSWQVQNVGGAVTGGGWSEQILLVNKRGTVTKLLGTVYQQETLAAAAVMSRQADIIVPQLLGIEGEAYVQVNVIANSETGESALATGNNTAQCDETFTVSKRLFVEPSPATVTENYGRRIAVKVSRSGDWNSEQTFTLSTSEDSRATLTTQVTIPAGQSGAFVYMTVTDNDVLDDNSIVTITASGNNYPDGTGQLVIEDNEYPNLTLTTSKSEITEGETFQLTVTTSRVSAQPIEVTLTSENTKRFSFPQTVTIPAGETSATVEVTAIDDELPSLVLPNAFTASATKHNKAEVIVLLKDNDLPVLELTLTPTTVQESAGVIAVAGVLKRTTNTNSKITVKLTDDANGGLYFGNRTLVLDKGVEEVHFNFGPVDNAIVDGDRTYTVTAAVWISSCSCGASGESAGYVEAQLRVLDNDGAALNVSSSLSTVKEGGKTMLTVSRNTTDTSQALTVTINSDYEEGLTYDHTVTIPAGQQSVTVEVTSAANSVQGDSHTVIFTVEAEGYASGTCYLMVTDQTLPDARISSIIADVTEAEVGTKAKLTIEVTNEGAAELPAEVSVKIFRRGDNGAIGTIYTSDALPVGGSVTLTQTITLPTTVGSHSYYALVNESNKVQELSYNNNTSQDVAIKAVAPFSVTVSTDKAIYKQGDKIIITGQLTGNGTANTPVDLYVINESARQVQTINTDANGAFTYEWQLYALQSGHFIVGACYPNEGLTTEMAAFDVYGIRRTEYSNITCDVISGDTHSGTLGVVNPGNLDLTGVNVELLSAPSNCEATLSIPSILSGGTTTQLSYSLKALAPSTENKWDEVKARISTQQGVSLDVTLYFYSRSAKGKLVANTQNIVTTMTKGNSREYSIQVTNTGRGSTGKIALALPDFIKSLSGNTLPALEQNETLTIVLSLTPTESMNLNVPVTGQLGINCENGDGTYVKFNVTPVSELTGILLVDVTDEYSYYTAEAPHVSQAEVVVRNPTTNALVTQGRTGEDGLFSVELPEGYYRLSVTANRHDSFTSNIYVDPGKETVKTVNLSVNSISVSWEVEETEVEDQYEIVTTVSYETNVPVPTVVINAPSKIDGDNMQEGESVLINVLLTNKGLITANNVELFLPETSDEWSMTPLAETAIGDLSPQQTVVVPVMITKLPQANSNMSARQRRAPATLMSGCMAGMAYRYEWICGTDIKSNEAMFRMAMKTCALAQIFSAISSSFGGGGGGIGGSGGGGGGGVGTPNNSGTRNYSSDENQDGIAPETPMCDPCQSARAEAVINGLMGLAPGTGTVLSLANSGADIAFDQATRGHVTGQSLAGLGASVASPAAEIYGITRGVSGLGNYVGLGTAVLQTAAACIDMGSGNASSGERNVSGKQKRRVLASWMTAYDNVAMRYYDQLSAVVRMLDNVFGDEVWYEGFDDEVLAFYQYLSTVPDSQWPLDVDALYEHKPSSISNSQFAQFISRINHSDGNSGSESQIDFKALEEETELIKAIDNEAIANGYESMTAWYLDAYAQYVKQFESTSSVCSTVTLQFKQTMTMTRQAFRGTLTVFNGNETEAMREVKLTLTVSNTASQQVATSHEFQINTESLDGFTGELDLGAGWTLDANQTGTATVLFIPTKYAAPEEPVEWSFGGTLSYIDPFTGLEVTRELYPVTLTVKPCPELDLTYFMQRDVYGDDPLTLDVVEPMKPAEFALLINNKGYGDATNVNMVTQQPEIIENEKGLYIDFELISSQVNGGEARLSFSQSVANEFGTIPAHSQMYAQWWLTSTLLGHFVDYKVEASHVTSYGNEDLSLLDQVTIHELIHGFDMPEGSLTGGPEIGRAFLVNDIADALDLPDKLYFTNGDTASVAIAATAKIERISDTTCQLTIIPSAKGWNYGNILDPTHGYAELKSIVRQSDGKELGNTRFWQTDRSLRDGKDWLYEYRLHFVDDFADGGEQTYLLTFDPMPEKVLEVTSIGTVPAEGEIAEEPIEKLTVDFNKEIDATTFTGDDITFAVQGVKKNANQIDISTEDNKRFTLDMTAMNDTLPNGYYTMTVQTADITDAEGYKGKTGKQTSWILFRGGLIVLNTAVWPAKAGNIDFSFDQSAGSRMFKASSDDNSTDEGTAKYGSIITFTATPDEGHQFLNWTLNGEVVSTNPTYTVTALSDLNVVANFSSLPILVEVEESEGGHIEGLGTGIYEHHAELTLKAVPDEDYVLKEWLVNGEVVSETSETLKLQADAPMTVKAVFEREFYSQTMTLARGWNWVSSYISEEWPMDYINSHANRVVGQFDELISDPQYGLVGGLEQLSSGLAYKVEALERFSTSFRGHLHTMPIALKKGWNWVAYPWTETRMVSAAITDAEEGDYLVSQHGFTEYADGYWEGTLRTLTPGEGYLYKSVSDKQLGYDFTDAHAGSRASQARVHSPQIPSVIVDIYSYPNTMNITARLCQDGMELAESNYVLYAMNGDEVRGVAEFIGSNYYLTVYGEQPVDITFIVENITTGETFVANEHLTFRDDVVGSRNAPFSINFGESTGISNFRISDLRQDGFAVYDLSGRKIVNNISDNRKLPKGVYIVNGHKVVNGKYVNK